MESIAILGTGLLGTSVGLALRAAGFRGEIIGWNRNLVHAETAGRMGALDRIAGFTSNHQKSGAKTSLSDYYTAAYDAAVFDKSLRRNVVFSDHSLATDSVFAEMHLVSCRNVLIYFNRQLQERALGLFRESLVRKGFLGLGSKESLRFSSHAGAFDEIVREERIFQKKGDL